MQLITDRVQADVDRVAVLAARVSAGTATAAELVEWQSDLKGAYNASDLNRVGVAVQYVASRLENEGGIAVDVAPKTDWTEADIPGEGELARYLADIEEVRGKLALPEDTPETPERMGASAPGEADGLDWGRANDIERILQVVDRMVTNMTKTADLGWAMGIAHTGLYGGI